MRNEWQESDLRYHYEFIAKPPHVDGLDMGRITLLAEKSCYNYLPLERYRRDIIRVYCQARRAKAQRVEPFTRPRGEDRDTIVAAGARALQQIEHTEFDFYVRGITDPAHVLGVREEEVAYMFDLGEDDEEDIDDEDDDEDDMGLPRGAIKSE